MMLFTYRESSLSITEDRPEAAAGRKKRGNAIEIVQ